jgi:hypothetical protein
MDEITGSIHKKKRRRIWIEIKGVFVFAVQKTQQGVW